MEAAEVTDTERCRCCMASGTPGKDLSDQYDWMGEKEVYADMLLESFDVTLSQTVDAGWKICDACVVRLRDSANFKKQVLSSEQNLLLRLGGAHESTSKNVAVELKVEKMKAETAGSEEDDLPEFETHFYDDEDELKDSSPVKFEARPSTSNTEMSNDEDVPLSALSGTKRKAPRAEAAQAKFPKLTVKTTKTAKVAAKPKVTAKPVVRTDVKLALQAAASKANAAKKQSAQTLLSKLSARPIKITVKSSKTSVAKKGLMHEAAPTSGETENTTADQRDQMRKFNSAILIECSTVCPFKWSAGSGVVCFYCERPFSDPTLLRQHTSTEHAASSARPIIRRVFKEELIKVDVTVMNCKRCSEEKSSLSELVDHLKNVHERHFYDQVNEGVIPYRLASNGFVCVACAEPFRAFHLLNSHMKEHYCNYFCETCGAGFVSQRRLKVHQNNHLVGSFKCSVCGETFDSLSKRKSHLNAVHSEYRSKCPQCPATFRNFQGRQTHLIKEHGMKHLQHNCGICGKVFVRKTALRTHMRKDHMKEKNERCDKCGLGFFSKSSLNHHMVKHNGERIYECAVCSKSFARRKTLVNHLRIHNNDRRFACAECGVAFIQNCSLKSHMKKNHPHMYTDIDITSGFLHVANLRVYTRKKRNPESLTQTLDSAN